MPQELSKQTHSTHLQEQTNKQELYYQNLQVRTIQEALNPNSKQLSKIKLDNGENAAKLILIEAITDVVMFFNVGKTMNEQQLIQTVDLILQNYWYLRISEFKYLFNKAKIGAYGKLYDRIDGSIIFEWIDKYLEERKEALIQNQIQKQQEAKKDLSILEALHDKGIKFEPKNVEEKPVIKEVEKTDKEKFIQDCFKEFDKLFLTYGIESNVAASSTRFINLQGKIYDCVTFIEMKLESYGKTKDN